MKLYIEQSYNLLKDKNVIIYQFIRELVSTLPFIEAEIQDIYIKYINMKQIFKKVKK